MILGLCNVLESIITSFSAPLCPLPLPYPPPRYLYELFDPFSVTLYIPKSSKRLYDIQCELYKAVNTELTGLEIMRPHAITLGTKSSVPPIMRANSSNGGYQPLTPRHGGSECTDYYVVMSPNRPVLSEHDSDVSGESNTSENLSLLEQHNRRVEDKLGRTVDELQSVRVELAKLQAFTEHLRKFCESLQIQIRMIGTVGKPVNGVDNRGPAMLPGELGAWDLGMLAGSTARNV